MCSRQGTYCYCMFRKNGGEAEASLCVTVCPVRSSSQKSGPSSWGKGNSILFLTSESSDVVTESEGHSVVSDSLVPHEVYSPWNSPGQNTEAHSLSLLQGIIPSQGSNPGLLGCRQILYHLSHQGSPKWTKGRPKPHLSNLFRVCTAQVQGVQTKDKLW